MTTPVTSDIVGEVLDWYRAHGVAAATLQLAPSLLPADWADITAKHGLTRALLAARISEAARRGCTDVCATTWIRGEGQKNPTCWRPYFGRSTSSRAGAGRPDAPARVSWGAARCPVRISAHPGDPCRHRRPAACQLLGADRQVWTARRRCATVPRRQAEEGGW